MFDTDSSLLDHWDSDAPVWTAFSPRRQSVAAADRTFSVAERRCAIRPNASQYPERADSQLETDSQ